MLEFRLLGPVEAYYRDRPISLGGTKPRILLAALALEHGRLVPVERLVDLVWGDDPPDSARALIQTYIYTLRRSFARSGAPQVIVTQAAGYALRSTEVTTDIDLFMRYQDEARRHARAGETRAAAQRLRDAIALWRGPALADLQDSPLAAAARRLDDMLLAATEERFAAELSLGQLGHLAELTAMVSRHPTNERLRGHLMVTLYRSGRQADALACYREGREVLVDELGVEPGPELESLHSAVLRGDTELLHAGAAPQGLGITVVPAQLPSPPADFTGRGRELEALTEQLLADHPGTHNLTGPGGSGKSTLATQAAHEVAASYPDGQLYAELRGMSDSPAPAGEVLGGFLRSLGVDATQLPESTKERAELYRSILAERRVLILLDDAANEQQVRPLLPGGRRSAVVITSRDRLAGLAGSTLHEVEVMPGADAWDLLARIVGGGRMEAEPQAAQQILQACGWLPLAIRIAGARLATRRQMPLKVLADRLTNEAQRLDELSAGDLAVRTTIELSYRALAPAAMTALGRMGHLGLPNYSSWTVGWLMDVPVADAERLLEQLVDAQLVELIGIDPVGVLRYRMHDLVRLCARELAQAQQAPDDPAHSVGRVVKGWLALARRVAAAQPLAEKVWRRVDDADVTLPDEVGEQIMADAAAWFESEEAAIATGVEKASTAGLHELVCHFVSARTALGLESTNRFVFRSRIIDAALTASRRAGSLEGEALMLTELAQLRYAQDMYADSRQTFGEALGKFRMLRDVPGQAAALAGLGLACREAGRLTEALHFLDSVMPLLQALDDQGGLAYVSRVRGSVYLELGNFEAARADLDHALACYLQTGSQRGKAYVLRTLGLYHRARQEYEQAFQVCEESAAIFQEIGDALMHAYAVRASAKTQIRMGQTAHALPRLEWTLSVTRKAHDRWGQAATLLSLAQLHRADGRLKLAQSCLDAAMSIWDQMESPLWRARTLLERARVLHAMGQTERAVAAYAVARKVFHHHGSREDVELPQTLQPDD